MRRAIHLVYLSPGLALAACSPATPASPSPSAPAASAPAPPPAPPPTSDGSARPAPTDPAALAKRLEDSGALAPIGDGGTGIGGLGSGREGTGATGGLAARGGSAAPRAAPSITLGAPSVTGDLDVELIKREIRRNAGKLRYCYDQALGASPALGGTVTATFMIADNGTVRSSTADGVSAEVSTCIAGVIKSIEFPKPTGSGVVVTYPFTFAPAGG